MVSKIGAFMYFFIGFSMLLTTTASAYIDPATTAMLTQIIAGFFITLGVVFGLFRRKIMLFFKNISVNQTKRKIEKQYQKEQKASQSRTDIAEEKNETQLDVDKIEEKET